MIEDTDADADDGQESRLGTNNRSNDAEYETLGRGASKIKSLARLPHADLPGQNVEFGNLQMEPCCQNEELKLSLKATKFVLERDSRARTLRVSKKTINAVEARNSSHPGKSHNLYNQLSFQMKVGQLRVFLSPFEQFLRNSRGPGSFTYLHLIKAHCAAGDVAKAQNLFRDLCSGDKRFDGPESLLYNVMIYGLGKAGHIDDAVTLARDMTKRGAIPDIYTYNSIICNLGKAGKVDDALAFLVSMTSSGCAPDLITYNSLISSLGKAGRYVDAYDLYERMVESGCRPDLCSFNTLLAVFCRAGEVEIANSLFKFMKRVGCEPDVYTYTSLSVSLCRAGRVDEALRLSVDMTERGCAPNTATFNCWLDGLCKEDRVEEAHFLLQEMLRSGYLPDNITYSILIDASCKTRGFLDQSFTLLKDLMKSSDHLDSRTSEIVFTSFEKVGMLKQAKRIARNVRAKRGRST